MDNLPQPEPIVVVDFVGAPDFTAFGASIGRFETRAEAESALRAALPRWRAGKSVGPFDSVDDARDRQEADR